MNKIITCIFLFVLCSCKTETHSYDWGWSLEQCKEKEGVRYYNPDLRLCQCNNGDYIKRDKD